MRGRAIARQKRIERAEWLRRINFAAREFQRIIRGRIGRKIARVEKALLRIKVRRLCSRVAMGSQALMTRCVRVHVCVGTSQNTVPAVIAEALRMRSSDGKRRHIFWYKRKAERALIFRDYRLFVDRTGNMPPLHVVEANYIELEARIHTLEMQAANIVQKVCRCAHQC